MAALSLWTQRLTLGTNMIYYAVRHKPTGNFLPHPVKHSNKPGARLKLHGFSYVEPLPLNKSVVRLHLTENAAKRAMKAWAQGKWRSTGHITGSYFGEEEYEDYGPEPIAVPERKLEEMEVVRVELIVQ